MRREDGRPFARESLARRAAPFALAIGLAFGLLPLTANEIELVPATAATLLTAAIAGTAWLAPWDRLPSWVEAVPPLAFFAVIVLLREVQGGVHTGYAPLVFLPVLWLLLYGTRGQIAVAVAALGTTLLLPFLTRGDTIVASDVRTLALQLALAAVICVTVLRLVGQIRGQAGELERLASTDSLTGLANRRVWEDALPRELARSLRSGAPVAVALLDLDDFKGYNDLYGHQAGDVLLKEVASMWADELRESDLLARYGGEEFALILPDCGVADAQAVVDKVRAASPRQITCSAGVAIWDGVEDAESLLGRADDALYIAKRTGRDATIVAGEGRPAGA